ncbi:MAG: RICIN domain-containing protein [Streptomycetaceae bacterium]|nr:RICIN domain-containing protein [Streptomycetaceae bacterium]
MGIRGSNAGLPANNVLRQSQCDVHPDANQKWYFTIPHPNAVPNGSDLVMFSHVKDENDDDWYCFDIPGLGSQPIGTKVVVSGCNGLFDDNQHWWLERDEASGAVQIRHYASNGLCMALKRDGAWPEGAPLILAGCDDKNSRWFMVENSGY